VIYLVLTPNLLRAGDVLINADDEWTVVSSVQGLRAYADSYAVTLTHPDAGYGHSSWYPANTLFHVRRANTGDAK
jgi:hypothetical protein